MHWTTLYRRGGCLGPFCALIPDGKDLWRSWRRWSHKASLNTEQTSSADRYFFLPPRLEEVFINTDPRLSAPRDPSRAFFVWIPAHSTAHRIYGKKKPLNPPKICLELETKGCVMILSQWKHRDHHPVLSMGVQLSRIWFPALARAAGVCGQHKEGITPLLLPASCPTLQRFFRHSRAHFGHKHQILWPQKPWWSLFVPSVTPQTLRATDVTFTRQPAALSSSRWCSQLLVPRLLLPLGFLGLVWGFFSLFLLTWRSAEVKDNTFVAGKELI